MQFIAAIVVMAVRLGTVYGSISVLLCLSIVLCKTNVQRAVNSLVLNDGHNSLDSIACSQVPLKIGGDLLAIKLQLVAPPESRHDINLYASIFEVDPWPEVLDFFTRRWPAAAYYKKCELRGNLTSIRQESLG
eukprot:3011748-Amphidinium_carterae.1